VLVDVVRIGRGAENNDVALPKEFRSISRQHIEIRKEAGGYLLLDLDSGNGVRVNGQKVDTIFLKDGDEICIGDAKEKQEVQIRDRRSRSR
jgi:pSer/pThr/pTyr-binding forkhead associated (FHA) protein